MRSRFILRCAILALSTGLACDQPESAAAARLSTWEAQRLGAVRHTVSHVLLISVDGMHALDLTRYVASHPGSALAQLRHRGTTFLNASAAKPSDSYPGLLAIVTGGTPRSTGVFYDDSYDRALSPSGSACATVGTEVVYDESIDLNSSALDGGGGIDPNALPLDPRRGCTPVYPHQFLHVNTIFEVIKAAGLRTAWSDKHLSYELVNGPSGHGVDDLFTPEIAAPLPNGDTPDVNATDAAAYDAIKVQAIINEIDGRDHTGAAAVGVPAIFGMNFQAVSVGQKTAGYLDAAGTPSAALAGALDFVDASIGRMVGELKRQGLFEKTLVIVSAKHGQAPIDVSKRTIVSSKLIPTIVNGVQSGLVAQATQDDIALLWLTDQSKTAAAVEALTVNNVSAGIASLLSGSEVTAIFNDPRTDSRTPDVIALVQDGVIYTKPTATKLGEHGGFSDEDTHVPILLSGPGLTGDDVGTAVETRQIAPTILLELGLDPAALAAVRIEGTAPLPLSEGSSR